MNEAIFLLPSFTFIILQLGELFLPCVNLQKSYHRQDWLLNLLGLFIQGAVIPAMGYLIAIYIFPTLLPFNPGCLKVGWWGAFWLNFIFIDFLYYWQHRLLHTSSYLWRLHLCHHSSPRVDIWATSRNNIWVNFIFVYWAQCQGSCDQPPLFQL